ncbi:unnamed protein product [Rotaria socialis]|uniref:Ribosome biogenesis protein BRX1 homolog n=1 Tax=Rotaria socialis TaxID=392032 RepID=A0A820EH11_9BILA|nr:unnamed protein product [Rotaria socialis]CAF3355036.1 unnamed protein product [Rotaria socialis]CAF3392013.1 unnamed protein product [Rotaria socialis]CAF3501391.1 unnamed protein product [Rotaria socialis]CAF4116826.1 unnamed protein product [Rotaria socialis]
MTKIRKGKSTKPAKSNVPRKNSRKARRQQQIDADNNDESLKIHRLGPAPVATSSLVQRLPSTRQSDTVQSMKTSWINKQRVLVFSSRGISYLGRHVMKNLRSIMAHSKSEPKAEMRKNFSVLNEIAELRNCNKILFFDMKKKRDLYLWMASVPDGPTVKFLVENLHTMEELKLTGNCLRGSRPLLSFDTKFDDEPHWKLIKEILTQIFGTPKSHPKSQPFVDHVLTFTIIDNKIWLRNYQIVEETGSLAEIGPRFVLNLHCIFEKSFSGMLIYENPLYVAPNLKRHLAKAQASEKYQQRIYQKLAYEQKKPEESFPYDATDEIFQTPAPPSDNDDEDDDDDDDDDSE